MSVNMVFLSGFVGQDAKLGTTKSGKPWCNASVATSKKRNDTYETQWHRVVAFGKTAEILSTARKGDTVFLQGELQAREYEKDGVKRQITEVLAATVMVKPKEQEQQQRPADSGFGGDNGEVPF